MGEEIVTDFVLIHGAYQGGWIWKFVSERLRAKGHNVLAPTLDGCGERAAQMRAGITTETHAEEIAKLLYFHDLTNAVLVGTSSGGMVMARAAEQARERVARVVFADALALFDGESILDIVTRPTTAIDTPLARGPSREDAVGRLFATLEPYASTCTYGSSGGRGAILVPTATPYSKLVSVGSADGATKRLMQCSQTQGQDMVSARPIHS